MQIDVNSSLEELAEAFGLDDLRQTTHRVYFIQTHLENKLKKAATAFLAQHAEINNYIVSKRGEQYFFIPSSSQRYSENP